MDRITVVIDTREQEPYTFDPQRITAIRRTLPAGDYSLAGHEGSVAVERKSLADFVSTVIRGRERFHKELKRLAEYEASCIVVEADLGDIIEGKYASGAHPNSVLGAAMSVIVDFKLPVFFCGSRQLGCLFVEAYLLRVYQKVSKNDRQEITSPGDTPGHD
ncbi:MAG TPA: ERCC4 domain-containing protein [bacterium]|nr:ERCC4 domain-containing protein [bacterium]